MVVATDTSPALTLLHEPGGLYPLLAALDTLPPLIRAQAAEEASRRATETLSLIRGEAINQAVAETLPTGRRRSYAGVADVLGMTIYGVNAAVHRYRKWLGTQHG